MDEHVCGSDLSQILCLLVFSVRSGCGLYRSGGLLSSGKRKKAGISDLPMAGGVSEIPENVSGGTLKRENPGTGQITSGFSEIHQ